MAAPQEAWVPVCSDGEHEHQDNDDWRTRTEITQLVMDHYLPEVVRDGGVLDRLEESGQILLGSAAVE